MNVSLSTSLLYRDNTALRKFDKLVITALVF